MHNSMIHRQFGCMDRSDVVVVVAGASGASKLASTAWVLVLARGCLVGQQAWNGCTSGWWNHDGLEMEYYRLRKVSP